MRKIFKNRKGFSLGELMIVVAILGVLFGLGAVEVVKYKKKIKQLHYDSYAEIIFNAAQNRLTELYAAGMSDAFTGEAAPETTSSTTGSHSMITQEPGLAGAASVLFPVNSISEELISRSWAVEFDQATGFVYSAYYGEAEGEQWSDADRTSYKTKQNGLRKNATIGYYGSGSDAPDYEKMEDFGVRLSIINKDVLKAHIKVGVPSDYSGDVKLYLSVSSKNGTGSTGTMLYTFPGSGGSREYDLILDSLAGDSLGSYRFKDLYAAKATSLDIVTGSTNLIPSVGSGSSGLQPGEDIVVTAHAEYPDTDSVENTPPVSVTTNSLFAKVDGTTAYVRYGRHLQNLDAGKDSTDVGSGVGTRITAVVQDRSISFTEDGEDLWASVYSTSAAPAGAPADRDYMSFKPVTNGSIATYTATNTTGSGCTITGLLVTGEAAPYSGNGGIFDTFSGTSITGVNLSGAYVYAIGHAGGLAGVLEGTVIVENCTSYLLYPDYYDSTRTPSASRMAAETQWIRSAAGNAGGLFGTGTGSVTIRDCSSSSVVYAESNPEGDTAGFAGGFFGSAQSTAIEHSYADCYVYGPKASGGMGGTADSSTIKDSYSAGFLFAPTAAGTDAATQKSGGYIPGVITSDPDSYTVFSYSFGNVSSESGKDPGDKPEGKTLSESFEPNMDTEEQADFTTAYNIGKTGLLLYPYPVLKKTSGTGTATYMHHYGDWDSSSGISILWDNRQNPAITKGTQEQKPPETEPMHITPCYPPYGAGSVNWTFSAADGDTYTLEWNTIPDTAICPAPGTAPTWKDFRWNGIRYQYTGWLDPADNVLCQEGENGKLMKNGSPVGSMETSKTYTAQYTKKCNVGFYLTDYNDDVISLLKIGSTEDFVCGSKTVGELIPTSFTSTGGEDLSGLIIDGWYSDNTCSSEVSDTATIDKDTILYARVKCKVDYVDPRADGITKTRYYDYREPFDPNCYTEIDFNETSLTLDEDNSHDQIWYQTDTYQNQISKESPVISNLTVYGKWKCRITYKSRGTYVTTASTDKLVDYGVTFGSITPPAKSALNETIFDLDSIWYEECDSSGVCSKAVDPNSVVDSNMEVYAKWNGIVLQSKYGGEDGKAISYKYSAQLVNNRINGYAFNFDDVELTVASEKSEGDTITIVFNSWGTGTKDAFISTFNREGYSLNNNYNLEGIKVYLGLWDEKVDYHNYEPGPEVKAEGGATRGFRGNGIYVIAGIASGNKTLSHLIINDNKTLGNADINQIPSFGSGSSNFVALSTKINVTNPAQESGIWEFQPYGSEYMVINNKTKQYLGLSSSGTGTPQLHLFEASDSQLSTNAIWSVANKSGGTESYMKMKINDTFYYVYFNGNQGNGNLTVTTQEKTVGLFGAVYKQESIIF